MLPFNSLREQNMLEVYDNNNKHDSNSFRPKECNTTRRTQRTTGPQLCLGHPNLVTILEQYVNSAICAYNNVDECVYHLPMTELQKQVPSNTLNIMCPVVHCGT